MLELGLFAEDRPIPLQLPDWVVGVICMRNAKFEWVRSIQFLRDSDMYTWCDNPEEALKFGQGMAEEVARKIQQDGMSRVPMLSERLLVFNLDRLNEIRTTLPPLGQSL